MTTAAKQRRTRQRARGSRSTRRVVVHRSLALGTCLAALYLLWPGLLSVFSAWPQLQTIHWAWFAVMLTTETASFACVAGLLRVALRTPDWSAVTTSQLAGNALSRLVPGGAAVGAALQFRMLTQAGLARASVSSGLTTTSLIGTATLLSLPILALPALAAGRPAPPGLAPAAIVGGIVFVLLVGAGAAVLASDRPLTVVGRVVTLVAVRVKRREPLADDIVGQLLRERNNVRKALGSSWWRAILWGAGNALFDYLAVLAALTAVGAVPRPSLVLLAYVGARILALIPFTPGGLGFVEAGLTGLLVVAGVSGPDAVVATLAYRLVSFWIPIPVGMVAFMVHRRNHRDAGLMIHETWDEIGGAHRVN